MVAPRGRAARQILRLIEDNPARARRFRFTSAERLNHFVLRSATKALCARASHQLRQKWPVLSAAPRRVGNLIPLIGLGLSSLAAAVLAPAATMLTLQVVLAAMFLAWLGLRLLGALAGSVTLEPSLALTDRELPVYTVIAALYREAASANQLLTAIERLDYPGIMAQTPQAVR